MRTCECVVCGATVAHERVDAHERWHERLNEVLSLMISAPGERQVVREFNRFVVRGGQMADTVEL